MTTRTEALTMALRRWLSARTTYMCDPLQPERSDDLYRAECDLADAARLALDASDREGGTACAECGCARGCHGSGGCTGEDGMGCDCPTYASPSERAAPASTVEGSDKLAANCTHSRTTVDCAGGETDATCLDCGAVYLDDGQGWRASRGTR